MAWVQYAFNGDPHTQRAGHSATTVGKHIYVCGGRRGSMFYGDLLRYDTEEHKWETMAEVLPFDARANHSATLVERDGGAREIWVIGGQTNDDVINEVWALELDSGFAWRRVDIRYGGLWLCLHVCVCVCVWCCVRSVTGWGKTLLEARKGVHPGYGCARGACWHTGAGKVACGWCFEQGPGGAAAASACMQPA